MLNVDQWLLGLHHAYEELRYPMSLRVSQAMSYLRSDEKPSPSTNEYDHHRSDPHYEINEQVLTLVQGTRSKLDSRYSLILKSVVSKQHPIYWVRDDVTQAVTRVHVNDIRPITIPPTQRQAQSTLFYRQSSYRSIADLTRYLKASSICIISSLLHVLVPNTCVLLRLETSSSWIGT